MKKFRLHTIALLLIVSAAFTSCMNDDVPNEITLGDARVTAASGPDTAAINEEITINLTYNVDNTCGHFNGFVKTTEENTTTVIVEAFYDDTDCGGNIVNLVAYKFKEVKAGTYILKFKKSETEFITKTIVVS